MNQKDVYISYHIAASASDAGLLAGYLEQQGITCWYFSRNVRGDHPSETMEAIESCKLFLILLTTEAARSSHVINELELAISSKKPILPILFDPKVFQDRVIFYYLGRFHCIQTDGALSKSTLNTAHKTIVNLLSSTKKAEKPFIVKAKPYSGDRDFIFVSYSHKNTNDVIKTILAMQQHGLRVWYDEGIDPGTEWDDFIAEQIERCGYMVAFISKEYLESDNCKDELNFARDLNKKRLLVYLEDVQLPRGMAMRLNRLQAIHMYKYNDHKEFVQKLLSAEGMDAFLD